jgi:predicted DNA-binding protein YlxM (UPF0122 family)
VCISLIVIYLGTIYNVSMSPTPRISADKLALVKSLYLDKKFCIREVAETLEVSPDAVERFISRHKIPKRSYKEASHAEFERRPLSFVKQKLNSPLLKELAIIGTMLYWAEGYKGKETNHTIDFANSDPKMITLFLKFFRTVYRPDESKIRIQMYCYADQNVNDLIRFWSHLTRISPKQFTKPYVRSDFKEDGRKMKYGLIHVRYYDKKLLLDIKSMIESYVVKYSRVGGGVVNRI